MMKVYIAGKITGNDRYREEFASAARKVREQGNIPLCPAVLPEGMSRGDYMRICFAMIDVADEVLFLHNSEDSPGALLEEQYCRYIGKPYWKGGYCDGN